MDLTLTEDQRLLADMIDGFARDARDPGRARELEAADRGFDSDVWTKMAELGIAGATLPEKFGGAGLGHFEMGLIVEAFGRNAVPTPIFASIIEAGMLLADCADDGQQESWLPGCADGSVIMTAAYLETSRALDLDKVDTVLSDAEGSLTLTGRKTFVRNAAAADAIVCSARREGGERVLAIVNAGQEGLRMTRLPASGGETLWAIDFDGVAVEPSNVVAGNRVSGAMERMIQRGAAFKSCELVGIGQAVLDLSVEYASQRTQFGVPIGSFQAVHHHCAEMFRDVSVSRLLARQACAKLDTERDAQREVSFAKAKSSGAMPAVTRTAHQIHGAVGYYRDYPLELYYHRAIAAQAAFGDRLHHRRVLSDMLANEPERFRGNRRHEL